VSAVASGTISGNDQQVLKVASPVERLIIKRAPTTFGGQVFTKVSGKLAYIIVCDRKRRFRETRP